MNNKGSLDIGDIIILGCMLAIALAIIESMGEAIMNKLNIIIENMDIKQKVEYIVPITQHPAPVYGINLREGEI